MDYHNLLLTAFFVWSIPLGLLRSRFRQMVYRTDSWLINIKPVFWRELKALFAGQTTSDKHRRLTNLYRFYLTVYLLLLGGVLLF